MNSTRLSASVVIFLLLALLSCNKADTTITALPALNCNATTLATNAFTGSGTPVSTTLTVGLSNATAGSATFTLVSSGGHFTPATYTTTVTAGQASVAIPLTFDGTASVTSETLTIGSIYASGTCTVTAAITSGSSGTITPGTSSTGLAGVVAAAEAFKATLTAAQLTALQLIYTKTNAVKWSNFPQGATNPPRVGVMLSSLNATQLVAFSALMTAVLIQGVPNEGYDELEGVRAADDYLAVTNGNSGLFGSGNFYLAFLGTPSTTGLWELQYGGHHFAVANTYNGGKVTGLTPSFRGVEPLAPFTRNGRTYEPMGQERQAFADLLGSLSSSEQATAKLSTSFSDILLGPGKDNQFPATKQGLKVENLTAAKKALVLNAIKLYVNDLTPDLSAPVLAQYTADLDNTYIAYVGSGTLNTQSDYVRIDGPGVWIEYSAQGAAHPHSVWRDRSSDYGGN